MDEPFGNSEQLAEIERLRSEVDTATTEHDMATEQLVCLIAERDEARAQLAMVKKFLDEVNAEIRAAGYNNESPYPSRCVALIAGDLSKARRQLATAAEALEQIAGGVPGWGRFAANTLDAIKGAK
jgi:chaperonin cofactor prefoldin